ncbi:transposase [Cronobacter malonaticus]|nr:transposase [Cronobacter malonaticus]
MKRAYKYRFYPTPDQVELLAKTFGCVRFVYNNILRWRTDAYYERQEKIGYVQASAQLTALKKKPEFIWLNDVSCVPLQQSLRHQQTAFANFFAGRAAYPAFKSKRHKQAAELTASAFKYCDGNLHKATRKLINENQVVCVESLKVKNMIRNPSLSKAIADASWSEFLRQLRYKGEWAGRSMVAIDQFFPSSKRCSCCGFTMQKMPLDVRKWHCPECGADHDRDINVARNIKAAGLAVLACGVAVNP